VGVAVMDLVSGDVRRWVVETPHGLGVSGLAWSDETLWWRAGPIEDSGDGGTSTRTSMRTWDVERDGRSTLSEGDPGNRLSIPSVGGGAPGGFLAEGRSGNVQVDADGGLAPLDVTIPPDVGLSAASSGEIMSPDGSKVAALLIPDQTHQDDSPLRLMVGQVDGRAVGLQVVPSVATYSLLGWRSPFEVVVERTTAGGDTDGDGMYTRQLWVADLSEAPRPDFAPWISVQAYNLPKFAYGALGAEVVPAPDAPFAPDPRLVGLGMLAAVLVGWRIAVRVRSRRGHA
jgi:hypothetical protein